jgi:hypothetical protein
MNSAGIRLIAILLARSGRNAALPGRFSCGKVERKLQSSLAFRFFVDEAVSTGGGLM